MITIIEHPLIQDKLSIMRKKETSTKDFREILSEIAGLMAYEITRNLEVDNYEIETPICKTTGKKLHQPIVICPILRAGLGMVDGILKMVPTARVGHIGMYRDEVTHEPHEYYAKFPDTIKNGVTFIVDPMLATGGSAVDAITCAKEHGATEIKLVCLVGVQEGIDNVRKHHPDVDIFLAAKDEKLNENCYIVPGLGDAGDRIFGTK